MPGGRKLGLSGGALGLTHLSGGSERKGGVPGGSKDK